MDDAVVYLVPLGRNRYELYSEPPDDDEPEPAPGAGFFRTQFDRIRAGWRTAVHAARHGERSTGRIARLRDWAVSRIAEGSFPRIEQPDSSGWILSPFVLRVPGIQQDPR